MKFASFEAVVENIYKYMQYLPPRECNKLLQLAVSFAGGYIAGVFCAMLRRLQLVM
jgi:solute carrier family 25 (mitochondrial phosphate transporter), member 3